MKLGKWLAILSSFWIHNWSFVCWKVTTTTVPNWFHAIKTSISKVADLFYFFLNTNEKTGWTVIDNDREQRFCVMFYIFEKKNSKAPKPNWKATRMKCLFDRHRNLFTLKQFNHQLHFFSSFNSEISMWWWSTELLLEFNKNIIFFYSISVCCGLKTISVAINRV